MSELPRNDQGVSDGQLTCFREMPAFHQFLFEPIHSVCMLHRKWNERSTDLNGRNPKIEGSVSGLFCVGFKPGLMNLRAVRRYFYLERKLVKLVGCCRLGFVNASESLLQ
jgi:hypothetical protein